MSTPAIEPTITPAETPAPSRGLADLTETQRDNWLKTGDFPGSEPAPADKVDESAPARRDAETDQPEAPVEATPPKVGKPRDDTNARFGQLTDQKKAAIARAEAAEQRAAALESELAKTRGQSTPKTPESAASTAPQAQPTLQERIAKPDISKPLMSDADFFAAYPDASLTDHARYVARHELFSMNAERDQQVTAQTREAREREAIHSAFTKAAADYPDFDTAALEFDTNPVFNQLLFDNPLSAELLYHFSKHPAEGRALAAMEPLAAARAFGKLEASLSVVSSTPATPKTVSSAPTPPRTLGARHTPNAGDEVDEAIRTGDTGRYIDAENRRELAAMKGGRR